ncbi:hypothetical protein SOV_49630 [Sporomusa ovata DSM 2662]|uniref:Uncharacterized protein n=1 Tax=Sporomusa ovata TaxID=2378 RepID=A0A0U1L0I1_9FIRM|nr:hypothetical protein [Sporomusa ovata]EQB27336.1 hypothetical protein SOV_2c02320 [Sporomusa ovata DSM 2662]CQR73176.1 hypothetical protein SpAn4DRAFT_2408 [Sporomusa ovata]
MASYDKMVKYLVEKLQLALAPLEQIARNQSILVAQNKQMIDLLAQLNGNRETPTEPEQSIAKESQDITL